MVTSALAPAMLDRRSTRLAPSAPHRMVTSALAPAMPDRRSTRLAPSAPHQPARIRACLAG
jgi:hypothetical protein